MPGLCTPILLGLLFLSHNEILIDCTLCHACVKGSSVDLLSLESGKKIIQKVYKSHKWKRLEIKSLYKDMFNKLKWKEVEAHLDMDCMFKGDRGLNVFKVVNFIGAVKDTIESLDFQQKYRVLEDKLKDKYKRTFKPIPHVNKLPDDVLCRNKLKDANKTIAK